MLSNMCLIKSVYKIQKKELWNRGN